jgi:hypothetical protein
MKTAALIRRHAAIHPGWPACLLLLSLAPAVPTQAQQWVVDDAEVTAPRSCQVEGWWGEAEAWLLPACALGTRGEVTLGVGRLDPGTGSRVGHAAAEFKGVLMADAQGAWSLGAVVGGASPFDALGRPTDVWAYLPLTLASLPAAATLHLNVGWGFEREDHGTHTHTHRGLTWGTRGELPLGERVSLLAEVHGFQGEPTETQAGVRLVLLPDLLEMDLSYGRPLDGEAAAEERLGFQVGLAWTPPPRR